MSPDVKDLINACKTVRLAAQQIFEENKLPYFPPFPHGWCGCVSRVLGAWLKYNFPDDELLNMIDLAYDTVFTKLSKKEQKRIREDEDFIWYDQ